MKKVIKSSIIVFLVLIYVLLNILSLNNFPFMHSDESWLSGLSRTYLVNGSFDVTEEFFDLYPRNPHAIKIVFHLIQMLFIKILGYKLFTLRIISLIFGFASIFVFYKLCYHIFKKKSVSIFGAVVLALDIQMIYASHFARQEIIILFMSLLSFYMIFELKNNTVKRNIIIGILIGLSIGVHPNSFLIFIPFVLIFFYEIISQKKKVNHLFIFIGIVSIFVIIFVGLSIYFDNNFISNYLSYGESLGVTNTFGDKLEQLSLYYIKLYNGISGTYYTPNIKFQFVIFIFSFLLSVFSLFKGKKDCTIYILLSVIGINLGFFIIGRYGQPSIVLIFPYLYLLLIQSIERLRFNILIKKIISVVLVLFLLIISFVNIIPYVNNDYDKYLYNISEYVKTDELVLGNLNTEYYFKNGYLFDYRNLAYLKENKLFFEEYIKSRNIKYIIYPEELDYIYNTRPVWNIIYGNTYYYYEDMNRFLEKKCIKIGEFNSPYAMRIVPYMYKKSWRVQIYKVIY